MNWGNLAIQTGTSDVPPPLRHEHHHHSQNHTIKTSSSTKQSRDGMQSARGPYARKNRGDLRNVLLTNRDVAEKCQETLKAAYDGDTSQARSAAMDSGMSAKAAENWLAGDNPMSLTAFLNAYHNNATFKAWARKILLMENDQDPQFQAELARFIATVKERG